MQTLLACYSVEKIPLLSIYLLACFPKLVLLQDLGKKRNRVAALFVENIVCNAVDSSASLIRCNASRSEKEHSVFLGLTGPLWWRLGSSRWKGRKVFMGCKDFSISKIRTRQLWMNRHIHPSRPQCDDLSYDLNLCSPFFIRFWLKPSKALHQDLISKHSHSSPLLHSIDPNVPPPTHSSAPPSDFPSHSYPTP